MSRNSPSSSVSVVAAIGSVSYGVLPAERLLAIIAGESAPDDGERARLYQAISESEPHLLYDLAEARAVAEGAPELSGRALERAEAALALIASIEDFDPVDGALEFDGALAMTV